MEQKLGPDPTEVELGRSDSEPAPRLDLRADNPGQPAPGQRSPVPRWLRYSPFFTSACLFMSGLFVLFAPVPLILLRAHTQRSRAWAAAITNLALVYALAGPLSAAIFLVFGIVVALALPEFLERRRSVEASSALTLLSMGLVAGLIIVGWAQIHHVNPLVELKSQVNSGLDTLLESLSSEARTGWLGDAEPEEWKKDVLLGMPSAVVLCALVVVWTNLMLLLRLNPSGIREKLGIGGDFFRRWKAPELLLWPTIACGILLVFDAGWPSVVAMNLFKVFMAIYALQGLSILSFCFDAWNIRGPFRSIGYLMSVFLMLPLLLSLGFFDLWFDFRAKLRQS